jgi:acyl carrier protein
VWRAERARAGREPVEELVRRLVVETLQLEVSVEELTRETNLYELGLDSSNVIDLLTQVEGALGVTIDVEHLSSTVFVELGNFLDLVCATASGR